MRRNQRPINKIWLFAGFVVIAFVAVRIYSATLVPDGTFVSICGTVYKDANCNGKIDSGEMPLSGVTITLYESDGVTPAKDATGAVVAPTTTDSNGQYCFKPDATLLFARPYVVKETVPSGYTASAAVPGPGSGGTAQSSTSILVNSTTSGNTYQPNDFLVCPNGGGNVNICGTVYTDLDNTGTISGGDGKLGNVTIELHTPGPDSNYCTPDDVVVATTVTDSNGHYCFNNVVPGVYAVHENVPQGWVSVISVPGPGSGGVSLASDCIVVTATTPGTTYQPNDFLLKTCPAPVSICGTVYFDKDHSGTINGGDTKFKGVTIQLQTPGPDGLYCTADDIVIKTTATDAYGHYCFTDVNPGTYAVHEVVPGGYAAINAFPGTGSGGTKIGPDCIKVTASTPGTTYQPNDFLIGIPPKPVNICGQVFVDLDNSNTITSPDGKLAGVVIRLQAAGPDGLYCTADDIILSTTTTDKYGKYCFTGIAPGTYAVHEVVPNGYVAVNAFPGTGSGGTAIAKDCIKVTATTPGTTYQPNNFLVKTGVNPVNICGNVYKDVDNSGTINSGDTKVASVTIRLQAAGPDGLYCTADDVILETQATDANGNYCFMGVAPGTYAVHEVVPSGYVAVNAFPGTGSGGTTIAPDCIKVTATTPGTTYQPNDFLIKQGTPGSGLTLTKLCNKTSVTAGQPVNYTYVITNNGSTTVSNITITDDNGTPTFAGDDFIVAQIPSLPAGQSMTFNVTTIPPWDTCVTTNGVMSKVGTMIVQFATNGDVRAIYRQSRSINDNVYGTPAVADGWKNGHKFSDLTGSDKCEFLFKNGAGTKVVDVFIDYISAAPTSLYPSGYGTLGFSGGDGSAVLGSQYVLGYATTLSDSMNQSPAFYGYKVNSPTPESSFPTWDYVDGYTIIVSHNAFGTSGFGSVSIPLVHNSPPKSGNGPITPVPCSSVVTNTATATGSAGSTTFKATAQATVNVNP